MDLSADTLDNDEYALALPTEHSFNQNNDALALRNESSIENDENENGTDIMALDPVVLYHNKAATRIQTVVRRVFAVRILLAKFLRIWQRVYDPKFDVYFWYNNLTKETQWTRPVERLTSQFQSSDIIAVRLLQRVIRSFIGKMRARHKAHVRFTRYFDPPSNKFYWIDNRTQLTSWKASKWLLRQTIPLPPEDSMLLKSQQRIKELEDMLARKDNEIKGIRKKRYDELEPQVILDRVKNAKDLVRSKHMDEWTMDQLSAWFVELKMGDHCPLIYANRIDGLLFINLSDSDWSEMHITSKIHIRKLQIVMKTYRIRYQRKKDKMSGPEDDDLSEYSPSEVSNMIGGEARSEDGSEYDEEEEGGGDDDGEGSEDGYDELTEEQRIEREIDDENINVEVIIVGDELNYPLIGDVIRVRYSCCLVEGGKILASTKSHIKKTSVEFVLGYNQVIKGFDRAIPRMSIGERSKLTFTPEYAYGKEGFYPNIPPDAEIEFDLTLLGFKPRAVWIKPLVQEPSLCQQPYFENPDEAEEAFVKAEQALGR